VLKYNRISFFLSRPEIPPYICTTDYYDDEQHDDNYPEYGILMVVPSPEYLVVLLVDY
jgi:hypothetical protein